MKESNYMNNILIRGCPGTGKTIYSRALAYYLCIRNLNIDAAFSIDPLDEIDTINDFIENSGQCEFIQIHPAIEYSDIVYGMELSADKGLNIYYAEKRLLQICNKALAKESEYFSVIFDDIDRVNAGQLLGNVLYAMEYRNQSVSLSDGNQLSIPPNVFLIFTENPVNANNNMDFAVRRRMTYVKELKPSVNILKKYYKDVLSSRALNLITDVYERICDYVLTYFENSDSKNPLDYLPGHGMLMVNRLGNQHLILDNIRQKIRLQILPYLQYLYSIGELKLDPSDFVNSTIDGINTGIEGVCNISKIYKKFLISGKTVDEFTLEDSRNYYSDVIVANKCLDYRGMMECILDAIILNGVFPYDVLMDSILLNTSTAFIESLHTPIDKASFLVEKYKANRFMYETVRGGRISGTHAYYSLDPASTGRWKSKNDTEEYIIEFRDGRTEKEFVPISGFRNHGFNPDSNELGVQHNTVNIMTATYLLIKKYYQLFALNIDLLKTGDTVYEELYTLILLEERYLDYLTGILNNKIKYNDKPTGDEGRLDFFGSRIRNLKLLWSQVGEIVSLDKQKYDSLVSGNIEFSLESYEDMYNIETDVKEIEIKGVLKMVDLKDYQKIMENIGIHQMIFQGPPGTSKTFETKRFVLKNLNSSVDSTDMSQEDISKELDKYKLTDEDYDDPEKSEKLKTGGWDLVQFHPSYGYEDFIRGIEVTVPDGSSTPNYKSINRILGKIAEFSKIAEKTSDGKNIPKFYLVIDEINRANLATVFGELIYGLEYRNSKVSTPYEVKQKDSGTVSKDIILGKNLFIIGTMNTADKSIDAIDYAIRRRFIFVDSPADRNVVMRCYQKVSKNEDEKSIELFLFDSVQKIFNENRFFNTDYQRNDVRIGHTYFLRRSKPKYKDEIIERMVFQVIPILREYMKDGILETAENLLGMEHTVSEIKEATSGDEQIKMMSENIMLYVKEFGNMNKSNIVIDNEYVGSFINSLCSEMGY